LVVFKVRDIKNHTPPQLIRAQQEEPVQDYGAIMYDSDHGYVDVAETPNIMPNNFTVGVSHVTPASELLGHGLTLNQSVLDASVSQTEDYS